MDRNDLIGQFEQRFGGGGNIRLFFAPARVNLIGEHTDHNGGLVFPAAISLQTVVAARVRDDNVIRIEATDLGALSVSCPLDRLSHFKGKGYGAYQLGVADELQKAGYSLRGCDMLFWGDIPFGSGLSSSASIEVVTGVTLAALSGFALDRTELALVAQRAENNFVGMRCGIMDQFASANGKRDHAVLLDCNTLDFEHVPLRMDGHTILIINTNKPRSLTDSKYNERRAECEQALAAIRTVRPQTRYLCELTPDEFAALSHVITDESARRRARHAVTENERVKRSVGALRRGDLAQFGDYMRQSHISLRDDYEVTGEHLDSLFEAAKNLPGVLGVRMTGAGFGGCAVAIVRDADVDGVKRAVAQRYERDTGLTPSFYTCIPWDGAGSC